MITNSKLSPENTAISVLKVLIGRNYSIEKFGRQGQRGDGGQQPRVAGLALFDVEPGRAFGDETRTLADFLKEKRELILEVHL